MSRPRKPTRLHVVEGTYREDRHGDPGSEPGRVVGEIPECPQDMGEAGRKVWETVLPTIHDNGYLHDLDLHAFERFARLHDDVADCERAVEDDGAYHLLESGAYHQHPAVGRRIKILEQIRHYHREFWLTPTARAGKQVAKKEVKGISTRKRTG